MAWYRRSSTSAHSIDVEARNGKKRNDEEAEAYWRRFQTTMASIHAMVSVPSCYSFTGYASTPAEHGCHSVE
ncbi:hypothetical protein VDGE_21110 [Verticillium dahliae]|uniref:Uncharacterized protein n=1 Tax=Verticillium dahliae TaxID=27337 RepID=A0A444SA02_VERDA|nr:hypothetical protein VDGE_21110 [Verticillium dahliae]